MRKYIILLIVVAQFSLFFFGGLLLAYIVNSYIVASITSTLSFMFLYDVIKEISYEFTSTKKAINTEILDTGNQERNINYIYDNPKLLQNVYEFKARNKV